MNWHYAKNGEQHGPVSEDELKNLHRAGEIQDKDLVWREGFTDWVAYEAAFGTASSTVPTTSSARPRTGVQPSPIPAGSGTGGKTSNAALRAAARAALAGQWKEGVIFTLLFFLITLAAGFVPLGSLILFGPILLGVHEFFVRMYRRGGPDNSQLFSGFSNFLLGFLISLLIGLISFAAMLTFMIPGFIMGGLISASGSEVAQIVGVLLIVLVSFALFVVMLTIQVIFAPAYLIALEEPDKGAIYAIQRCPQILRGYKLKLFMMLLVFFGWSLLTVFTFMIGLLWVVPYYYTSLVAFYDDLKEPASA